MTANEIVAWNKMAVNRFILQRELLSLNRNGRESRAPPASKRMSRKSRPVCQSYIELIPARRDDLGEMRVKTLRMQPP